MSTKAKRRGDAKRKRSPAKKSNEGHPVFSFRCPARIQAAFRTAARKRKVRPGSLLVAAMTGYARKGN